MEKLYTARDMAKIGCSDCKGCSACCQGMGDTIHLTPYDMYMLCKGLEALPEELLADGKISLTTEEGMIFPHLKMQDETDSCGFLNAEGRCDIHPFRPGLCRLFPLGRSYDYAEDRAESIGFHYFVVEDACPQLGKTKVRIDKWLAEVNLKKQEEYLLKWHNFYRAFQERMLKELSSAEGEPYAKQANMAVLQMLFLKPYDLQSNFYPQFEDRLAQICAAKLF